MIIYRSIFDKIIEIDVQTANLWQDSYSAKGTDYWQIRTKLSGVSFKPSRVLATCGRRKIINDAVSNMNEEEIYLLTRNYISSKNHVMVKKKATWLSHFIILEREPTNEYDPNAIVALIKSEFIIGRGHIFKGVIPDMVDVGYIPKVIAEAMAEQNLNFFLVGVSFATKGNILLNILLKQRNGKKVKKKKGWDKTVQDIGFVSLSKIRRLLGGD